MASPSESEQSEEQPQRPARRATVDAKFSCAVSGCCNSNGSLREDESSPIIFFDLPATGNARSSNSRMAWFRAVPSLCNAIATSQTKVCEEHFVDGRPTDENPAPTLKLDRARKRSVTTSSGSSHDRHSHSPSKHLADSSNVADSTTKDDESPTNEPANEIQANIDQPDTSDGCDEHKLVVLEEEDDEANDDGPRALSPQEPIQEPDPKLFKLPSGPMPASKSRIGSPKPLNAGEQRVMRVSVGPGGRLRSSIVSRTTASPSASPSQSRGSHMSSSSPPSESSQPNLASVLAGLVASSPSSSASGGSSRVGASPSTSRTVAVAVRKTPLQREGTATAAVTVGPPVIPNGTPPTFLSSFTHPHSGAGQHECRIRDIPCDKCMASFPHVRRSLGRLEARFDAVSTMIKQLVAKHPQTVANTITIGNGQRIVPRAAGGGVGAAPALPNPLPHVILTKGSGRPPIKTIIRPPLNKGPAPSSSVSTEGSLRLQRYLAKCILLHNARSFTLEEFLGEAPKSVRSASIRMIISIVDTLVKDGLLLKGEEEISVGDTILEKNDDRKVISKLALYDCPIQEYQESFH